jgi:hypothetical protein
MARLLQRVPPQTLIGGVDAETDSDDEKEEGGKEGPGALSLAASVLPSVQQHGLTRAELVLRVSACREGSLLVFGGGKGEMDKRETLAWVDRW